MEKTIKGFIQALSEEKYQTIFKEDKENHVFFVYNSIRETNLFKYLYDEKIDQCQTIAELIKMINEYDYKQASYKILRFFDVYNNFQDEFYKDILFDISLIMAYLNTLAPNFGLKIDDTYTLLGLLISPKDPVKRLTEYLKKMYPIFIQKYDEIIEIDNLTKNDITEKTINRFQVFDNNINGQIIELLHDKPLNQKQIMSLLKLSEQEVSEHLHDLYKYDFLIVADENYSLKKSSFQELADILKKYIDET